MAYKMHYTLKLSVSHFLIQIGQALSNHINENSEKLRKIFVYDQKEIEIIRDEFILGGQNDWSNTFEEFCEKIRENTNSDVNNIIIDNTSVATINSKVVSQICLMESMKKYFSYRMVTTKCGIPSFILVGSTDDWKLLKEKVDLLCKMNENDRLDLDWWLKYLVPVVEKIVETAVTKKPDDSFWNNIAKIDGTFGSGGTQNYQGWVNVFNPYLSTGSGQLSRNMHMDYTKKDKFNGIKED